MLSTGVELVACWSVHETEWGAISIRNDGDLGVVADFIHHDGTKTQTKAVWEELESDVAMSRIAFFGHGQLWTRRVSA